jgi:hypothetical protein
MDVLRLAVAAGLAVTLASVAAAQEPTRLERFAGLCRDGEGAALGAYAGRVLWLEDGQLSGMMTRDEAAEAAGALEGETVREGFAPRSLMVHKQTPEVAHDGLVLHTRAVLMSADGEDFAETAIVCVVAAAAPVRPDPGASGRG